MLSTRKRQRWVKAATMALSVAVIVTACGGDDDNGGAADDTAAGDSVATDATVPTTETSDTPDGCPEAGTLIAYTPFDAELAWFGAISDRIEERAAECDVEFRGFDPAGDAVAQANGIENLLSAGVDAIAISAVDGTAVQQIVADATAAGVFVVQHVSAVPGHDANVGVPELGFGRLIGEVGGMWLLDAKPDGEYKVAVLNADTLGDGLLDRKAGLIEGLESALGGADYELVADVEAFAEDTALDAVSAILSANPDLDLVLAVNDVGALGALAAFESAGLTPNVDIAAVGSLTERGLQHVIDGNMPGGITVPGPPHGDALAEVMFGLLAGTIQPGADILVEPTQITSAAEASEALAAGGF